MITPTRNAILAAAAGVPVTLLAAIAFPDRWAAALAWPLAVLLLTLADALMGARPGAARMSVEAPGDANVGETVDAVLRISVEGVAEAQFAIGTDELIERDRPESWMDLIEGKGAALVPLRAMRRGTARIDRAWLRWRGRLGLVWKQKVAAIDLPIAIHPDMRPVEEQGARLFRRHALSGLMTQVERGDGADFDALVEYRSGMDKRAIDWKQSARHVKLHAKEYRTERNNQIVFAVDAGRQMCEPVAGLTRLDRMVPAMLLTAWVALKLGDWVALHAFDSQPRIASGLVSGVGAFGALRRLAARIDYSGRESNYTHALTTLSAGLTRRSMIVLFTELTDLTAADFLIRAASRLMETHLLMVVMLRDEELEGILARRPASADDITRAVTAAALLKDRLMLLTRLRHMGVHVVESEHDRVSERLVQAYVDLKRRNLL
ncbi:MAG: DUF58 domain-containing protein [Sphingobium sp.]